MGWYTPWMHGSGVAMMATGGLLFVGLLVAAVVIGAFGLRSNEAGASNQVGGTPTPQTLLAERYARGEIDDEEYQRRLRTLSR